MTTETAIILNRDLHKVSLWADKWKVTFNADKSEEIIFSKKVLVNNVPLTLNGESVKRVNTHKHLGLYLTYNWSYKYIMFV